MTQQQARKWKAIEAEFIKLDEVGAFVEGMLTKRSAVNYREGDPGEKYELVRDDGRSCTVLGTVELIDKMANVTVGAYVHIEYTGTTDTGSKSPMKNYLVLTEDAGGSTLADAQKEHKATAAAS